MSSDKGLGHLSCQARLPEAFAIKPARLEEDSRFPLPPPSAFSVPGEWGTTGEWGVIGEWGANGPLFLCELLLLLES